MIGCLDHLQIDFEADFRLQSCQSPCERSSCAQVATRSFQSEETALTQFLHQPTTLLPGHVKIDRDIIAIINEGPIPIHGSLVSFSSYFSSRLVLNSLPCSHLDQHPTCPCYEARSCKLCSTHDRILECS